MIVLDTEVLAELLKSDPDLRIPIQAGHAFRHEAGRHSELMSDGVPR